MRIVHVAPFYYPVIGGVEDVVKHIAEHVAGRGHEVYVVTYNRLRIGGIGSLPREEVVNGVRVIRLRPTITWSHGSYSPDLPQVIKSLKPDIVHVHVWRHPHVFQIAKLRRDMGFKAILHGHAPFHKLNQLGVITWAYHRLVDTFGRKYLKAYDKYIALTRHEANIAKRLGLDEGKIEVIPNGVEEDKCDINSDAKAEHQVLYLGRISKSKNITLLIRAMNYIIREVRSARLILAGPDEGLIPDILNYAERHGIDTRYMGKVDEEMKHKLYMENTVYTLPSLYEPFGITLLEAGIHGTPSVITGNGGQAEAAPPNVASLWAEPKPEKYGKAIATLLANDDLRRKLGAQAREWAQRYVWNKILTRYEELYIQIATVK
ncbi:glycosyl transferase, family 1 [Thermoproteus uzoniensis 768-20]|uniref:Glycosyl transferase, family 1 n=1 Tax=Thermoproteus uzoniensis (strain 768-20) TaxID=999630 RepID=F2L0X8_THEU7|nr:glycosyltransferase family 4 protein [Thermoproteus uzoniensis]AEA11527.1 glycosyl transferase, family 1 [Thermoproteus uzoniensis 768-20]